MKQNSVRHRLKEREATFGTWLTLPDPVAARLLATSGFNWITVELEHTPTTFETAALCYAMIAAGGTVPLARVPINSTENIKRVLDTGAWGVIVPMVNSRTEAEAAVAAARFPPLGRRSVGGQLNAANFDTDQATYRRRANDEILVVLMIEHVEGIANAEAIISTPGVDAVFIGPNDLLNSMGKMPSFESEEPDFTQGIAKVRDLCRRHGVAAGIHVLTPEAARRRVAEGFQFIALGSDAGFMLGKAHEITQALGLETTSGATAKY
ncbi:MAG TPA: 2-dehydro-3-deoxyglucarate aldolase [Verrucomicrobiales bacterium]|nr:2-dehydro-3-deoxyglucarate aldolase [Verrucomicrobiales bacterium]